ncbi:MAG TPA: iron ABC transporter substrate-binding protein [Micromonosporaceae bacterium]|nr:iron ABC transporter substrate-binding protein [Micromonosporaceae bacterium]
MRTFGLRSVIAVLSVGVVIGLAGCGVAGGDGESEITVYSGRAKSLVQPVIDDFSEATGITVNVRYGQTAAMASQILEEGDKTGTDVFLAQDAGALGAVSKEGLFAKLPSEITGRVSEQYRATDHTWVGVTGRVRVLVYNVDKVSEAELPHSVYELADPKWKSRVGIAPTNGSFQAFVTGMRVKDGDAKARDFLKGLKANDAQIREHNNSIVADVNTGTLDVGLVNHYYVYEKAEEVGKPVDELKARLHFFQGGDPGGLVNVSGVGVTKHSADDADVRKFVDYLLSKNGQSYFTKTNFEYPLIEGVAPAEGLPGLSELDPPAVNLNNLDSLDQTVQMITDSGLA